MPRQAAKPRHLRCALGLLAAVLALLAALVPATAAAAEGCAEPQYIRDEQGTVGQPLQLTEAVDCLPAGQTWTSALIHWGDGTSSTGTITATSSSPEYAITTVTGEHTYSQPGEYSISIAVSDQAGQTYEGGWHTDAAIGPANTPAPFPNGTGGYGRVEAPYLGAASEQLKEIAIKEEERRAKEREEKAQQERALFARPASELEHAEEQPPAAQQPTKPPACHVPALKGDTLTVASRALAKAHCRLGTIHRPAHHSGTLRVIRQSARPGKQLPAGSGVAVVLGAKRASRRGKGRG